MHETAFISLGPTCVPAEILKAGSLRHCTYGFDWFRSGGFYVKALIESDLGDFLDRYVFSPCIPLRQLANPLSLKDKTVDPVSIDPVYGFPYLYNPHRDLYDNETRSYFERAYGRLKAVIGADNVVKEFLIADYVNKLGASFLHEIESAMSFLAETLACNKVSRSRITTLRIRLLDHHSSGLANPIGHAGYIEISSKNAEHHGIHCRTVYADIASELDSYYLRRHAYRFLSKAIYGKSSAYMLARNCP